MLSLAAEDQAKLVANNQTQPVHVQPQYMTAAAMMQQNQIRYQMQPTKNGPTPTNTFNRNSQHNTNLVPPQPS